MNPPHVPALTRRWFLELLGGAALASPGVPVPTRAPIKPVHAEPLRRERIRAVAFDLFTIFDPREIDRRVAELPKVDATFAATWKTRLFEYSWIRAASGQYADFERLVHDSLVYAAGVHHVSLGVEAQHRLESAFTELTPWPDAPKVLRDLAQRGLRLATLANFTPRMIDALLARSGLTNVFEARISTDFARTYKPDPRAYALAETTLGLRRREIAFAAFGGWDAAGARWFGLPSFWVNRLGAVPEELIAADASGPTLRELATWIEPVR
jgi:2-haloacid dehalogenase